MGQEAGQDLNVYSLIQTETTKPRLESVVSKKPWLLGGPPAGSQPLL